MTHPLHDADDVRAWLADRVYQPTARGDDAERVGLEAELFPFWMTRDGRPAARLALVEIVAIVDDIDGAVRKPDTGDGRPSWLLDGTLITEEPGAQVEIAGPPAPDAATAITGLEQVAGRLTRAFTVAGAGLAATGLDCWSEPDEVPVQLEIPRYHAMTTYFRRRGGREGHLLMCASCSLQVNVDLGPADVAERRWLLANLAAPVFTAAFATSPLPDAVNGRALGWRGLDPTRTGVPPPLIDGLDDPLEHALADCLRADVLIVYREGEAFAGTPGWSFGDWLRDGHHNYGRPGAGDLATHVSTLFPEARLRGYLEVRSIDQLPARWRGAAVAMVVGLLYDDQAREAALAALAPHRPALSDLLSRAATAGLRDPVIAEVSRTVLDAGVDGARRLGIPQATAAEAFLESYTHRGRHPSDELRAALTDGPAAAFAWAAER